jgi:plasmid stability protein
MSRTKPMRLVKFKRLTLDLPEDLHRAIKIDAAQEGVTMAEKLRALLLENYGLNPRRR